MKTIKKDELFDHVSEFLKAKGVELKDGSYTKGVLAGCSLLADAINLSQTGLERAKTGIDRKLEQVRQAIHERTAPKPPPIPKPRPATKRKPAASAKTVKTKRATKK